MRKSLTKAVMLGTLALTQSVGTVALIQNSIVQTYAEEKNKDVTSQQYSRSILILHLKRVQLFITLYKRHNKQNNSRNNS